MSPMYGLGLGLGLRVRIDIADVADALNSITRIIGQANLRSTGSSNAMNQLVREISQNVEDKRSKKFDKRANCCQKNSAPSQDRGEAVINRIVVVVVVQ